MPFIFSRIVPAIGIGIFLWLGVIIFSHRQVSEPDVITLKNWQDADAPFGYPIEINGVKTLQTFDPRFNFYTPWDRSSIPLVDYFQASMGTETWAYTYNAQPFNELNKGRGGNHSGDDINGIGGQNSDLGDPVYAAADGLVVYIGNPSPGWGNCIILAHRTPDDKVVQSMYAHLLNTSVYYHQTVSRGTLIGSVGQADVGYLAHLHLEMRESDGVSPFLSGYTKLTQHDRINPTQFIKKYQPKQSTQLAPPALSILKKNQILPQLGMQLTPPYDAEDLRRYQRYIIKANKDTTQQDLEN